MVPGFEFDPFGTGIHDESRAEFQQDVVPLVTCSILGHIVSFYRLQKLRLQLCLQSQHQAENYTFPFARKADPQVYQTLHDLVESPEPQGPGLISRSDHTAFWLIISLIFVPVSFLKV